jgi:hypothetical protein
LLIPTRDGLDVRVTNDQWPETKEPQLRKSGGANTREALETSADTDVKSKSSTFQSEMGDAMVI